MEESNLGLWKAKMIYLSVNTGKLESVNIIEIDEQVSKMKKQSYTRNTDFAILLVLKAIYLKQIGDFKKSLSYLEDSYEIFNFLFEKSNFWLTFVIQSMAEISFL